MILILWEGEMEKGQYWKFIVPLLIGMGICLIPVPQGLQPNAWYYFAVFSTAIAALIFGTHTSGSCRTYRRHRSRCLASSDSQASGFFEMGTLRFQ